MWAVHTHIHTCMYTNNTIFGYQWKMRVPLIRKVKILKLLRGYYRYLISLGNNL